MKKNLQAIALLILTSSLTIGCQTMNETKATTDKNAIVLQEIQNKNNSYEPILNTLTSDVRIIHENYSRQMDVCLKQIKEANEENAQLRKDFKDLTSVLNKSDKPTVKEKEPVPEPIVDNTRLPDGKMIFGEAEWIYVAEADASFDSRIDSGASISSISALDIEQFERDGKKWYRFSIPLNNSEKISMEAPWVRSAVIKQASSDGDTEERPVVQLTIKVGNLTDVTEVSLRNRSTMQYSLLIGREFIKDIAVVDVSRNHVQKKIEGSRSVGAFKLDKKGVKIPNSREIEVKDVKKENTIPAKPKTDATVEVQKTTKETSVTAKPKA